MIPVIPLVLSHSANCRADRAVSILLIDNFWINRTPGGLTTQISPHLGLMSLAAFLREVGHDVRLLDPKILYLDGGYGEPAYDFYNALCTCVYRRWLRNRRVYSKWPHLAIGKKTFRPRCRSREFFLAFHVPWRPL